MEDVIKKMRDLPPFVMYQGIEFYPSIFSNGSEIRFGYFPTPATTEFEKANFVNYLIDEQGRDCEFLLLFENIESAAELVGFMDAAIHFLAQNGLADIR